jgi:putative NADPH-quinone reductase
MAAEHNDARLLHDALERSGISARDRELWLEYVCEKAVGNPSPATTLGPVFAMKESTVRQAARRVRQRVHRLATTDERYAPLIALPVLA